MPAVFPLMDVPCVQGSVHPAKLVENNFPYQFLVLILLPIAKLTYGR
jgi:hypothetical protein